MSENRNHSQPVLFPYLPHTKADRDVMFKAAGVRNFEELIAHIPKSLRAAGLKLPSGLSELELTQHFAELAAKNKPASKQACFLGAGSYRRFVPAAVNTIVSRSEFATAYTPYQAEVSQGSLQVIYEFQTAICLLTDMEVANASMYDGPTACAEAVLMAMRLTGKKHIVLTETLNPEYALVTKTYVGTCGGSVTNAQAAGGAIEIDKLNLDNDTAALVVQYPNYFGCLEDLAEMGDIVHKAGALLIVVSDPISLGLLKAPGTFDADIVVGDAQPCGNYLSFGGPSAGFMATRLKFVRQLPGRLSGMTVDVRGQRAFTLTLQTREQHIRRAKATSNICTNQALNALAMLVYLTLMGPQGLKEVAEISMKRAHYLADLLLENRGVNLKFKQPFFNEFVIQTSVPAATILKFLQDKEILGGVDLGRFDSKYKDCILISVTEMNSVAELEQYARILPELLTNTGNTKSDSAAYACKH